MSSDGWAKTRTITTLLAVALSLGVMVYAAGGKMQDNHSATLAVQDHEHRIRSLEKQMTGIQASLDAMLKFWGIPKPAERP